MDDFKKLTEQLLKIYINAESVEMCIRDRPYGGCGGIRGGTDRRGGRRERIMKRVLLLLLAGVLSVGLAACGGGFAG